MPDAGRCADTQIAASDQQQDRGRVPQESHPFHWKSLVPCAVRRLQPGLAGEVPLPISLPNLPGVRPSLLFTQTLKNRSVRKIIPVKDGKLI